MKNLLRNLSLATAALASNLAFSDTFEPNHYVCNDDLNQTELTYVTTSKTGAASFSLRQMDEVLGETSIVRRSPDIQAEETKQMGSLVSVIAASIPDKGTITKTLILPEIRLSQKESEVKFETMLVTTDHRTSFFGSFHLTGNLSEQTFTKVTCVATELLF